MDDNLDNSGEKSGSNGRLLVQQCLTATLQVKPQGENGEAPEFVQIKRGSVVYVCFFKGASSDTVEKLVKYVMSIRLSEAAEGKYVSLLELPGDLLIIPQATLGGQAKGKVMQYHRNIDKVTGQELFQEFIDCCKKEFQSNSRSVEMGCEVKSGTYGTRQILKMETNGPYSHLYDV